MISMVVVVGAAVAASAPAYHQQTVGNRPLATSPMYPASMADSVHRPGFNGRLHMTRPVMGGHDGPYATVTGNPGADYYGAWGAEHQIVWARAGHLAVGINPWDRIPDAGLGHFERARVTWLRERGYSGGVRTFVNDASLHHHADAHASTPASAIETIGPGLPQPRATIHFPDGLPKRPRFQVDADSIGLPMHAPADMRARVETKAIRTANSR